MRSNLTYAAITPARNEFETLPRLAASLAAQSLLPVQWILVDNGSTDSTPALAASLVSRYDWIRTVNVPNEHTRPGAPVVRAFNAGLAELDVVPDVVVKLDADVSFEPSYFEDLLGAFSDDPALGIASGVCWEMKGDEWRPIHVTGDHVRGATRAYRWECLQDVGPLPEVMGWDGVDELTASVLGWRTHCIDDVRFFHHRKVGERDGARTARWLAEGRSSHYMGYRLSYMLARTLGRAVRDRDLAAFAMLWSFIVDGLRRKPRYPDERVVRYLRRQQSLKALPVRLVESFAGWRAS
jgi:glycosyltransferase involved in cell wall biosynthesis